MTMTELTMTDDRKDISYVKSAVDLNVFKRAYRAALEIHKTTLDFPKIEQYALADQLRRATKSICANISEGFAKQRYSKPEFLRYIAMAEGSTEEVRVWLLFARDLEYITSNQHAAWLDDYQAIAAMLINMRNKVSP